MQKKVEVRQMKRVIHRTFSVVLFAMLLLLCHGEALAYEGVTVDAFVAYVREISGTVYDDDSRIQRTKVFLAGDDNLDCVIYGMSFKDSDILEVARRDISNTDMGAFNFFAAAFPIKETYGDVLIASFDILLNFEILNKGLATDDWIRASETLYNSYYLERIPLQNEECLVWLNQGSESKSKRELLNDELELDEELLIQPFRDKLNMTRQEPAIDILFNLRNGYHWGDSAQQIETLAQAEKLEEGDKDVEGRLVYINVPVGKCKVKMYAWVGDGGLSNVVYHAIPGNPGYDASINHSEYAKNALVAIYGTDYRQPYVLMMSAGESVCEWVMVDSIITLAGSREAFRINYAKNITEEPADAYGF